MSLCLIVEKNAIIAQRIQDKIKSYYSSCIASTVEEAHKKLHDGFQIDQGQHYWYDAIILDIRIPKSKGLSITSSLPILDFLEHVTNYHRLEQIIVTIGFQEDELMAEITRNGATNIICKGPRFFNDLEEAIIKHLFPSKTSTSISDDEKKCRLHVSVIKTSDTTLELSCFLDDYCVGPYFIEADKISVKKGITNIIYEMEKIPELFWDPSLGNWKEQMSSLGKELWAILCESRSFDRLYNRAMGITKNDNIIIIFSGKPEILALPFELVLPEADEYLLRRHTIIRQVITNEARMKPLYILESSKNKSIRSLLVAANTNNQHCVIHIDGKDLSWGKVPFAPIPKVSDEVNIISKMLYEDTRFARPDVLDGQVTKQKLYDALKKEPEIFHFAGHGYHCKSNADESAVFVWDDNNQMIPVYVHEIKEWLEKFKVRFAYFGCCYGAETTTPHQYVGFSYFMGILTGATWARVPTILAFHWPLIDNFAVEFAEQFYTAWLRSGSFASAIYEARIITATKYLNSHYSWASSIMTAQDHGLKRPLS